MSDQQAQIRPSENDVFISYSRRDAVFMERLYNRFNDEGYTAWVDWEDIPKGEDFLNEIYQGIEGAHTFVFILSPNSLTSEVCNYEVAHAIKYHKRILPIILEDVTKEGVLDGRILRDWYGNEWESIARENWEGLRLRNWIFFDESIEFETAFSQLHDALLQDIDHVRFHRRLTVSAAEWNKQDRKPEFLLTGDRLHDAKAWLTLSEHKQPSPTSFHKEFIAASDIYHLEQQATEKKRRDREALMERQARTRLQFLVATGFLAALIAIVALVFVLSANADAQSEARNAQTQAALALANANTATLAQGEAQVQAELALNSASTATFALGEAELQAQIALDNASTATIAQGEAQVQAELALNSASTATFALGEAELQAQIALDNASTATVAQGQAEFQAQIALDNASTATIAQGEAEQQAELAINNAATATVAQGQAQVQAELALNNAATATVAQGEAEQQAELALDNAATATVALGEAEVQAELALNNAATATVAQGQAQVQAELALNNASTATIAQGEAEQQAELALNNAATATVALGEAELQAELALNNASTATVAQGEAEIQANRALNQEGTAVAALQDAEISAEMARAQALAVVSEQLIDFGDTELALALAVESAQAAPDLIQTRRVLNRALGVSPVMLANNIAVAQFMPNGEELLTLSTNRMQILVWTILDRNIRLQIATEVQINDLKLHSDGNRLIGAASDGSLYVWDVTSGMEVLSIAAHTGEATLLALHEDGRRIISTGTDEEIVVWDIDTGEEVLRFSDNPHNISDMLLNFNSRILITWSDDLSPIMTHWNVETGRRAFRLGEVFRGFDRERRIAWTGGRSEQAYPGDTNVASFRIWNATEGSIIRDIFAINGLSPTGFDVLYVDWSPDRLAMIFGLRNAFGNEFVALADMNDSQFVGLWEVQGFEDARFSTETGPGFELSVGDFVYPELLVTTVDGRVLLWNVVTGETIREVGADDQSLQNLGFNADNTFALTLSDDNTVRVWQLQDDSNGLVGTFENAHAVSPDGQFVVASDAVLRMYFLDANTGEQISASDAHDDHIGAAAFTGSGDYLITGDRSGTIIQWDGQTGVEQARAFSTIGIVRDIRFFSNDAYAMISGDSTAVLWNVADQRIIDTVETPATVIGDEAYFVDENTLVRVDLLSGELTSSFSLQMSEGAIPSLIGVNEDFGLVALLTGFQDAPNYELQTYNLTTGELLVMTSIDGVVTAEISDEGTLMLLSLQDNTLQLIDLQTGQRVRRFVGHDVPATTLTLGAGGQVAVSGSPNGQLILWEVVTGQIVTEYQANEVNSVWISDDGSRILARNTISPQTRSSGPPETTLWRVDSVEELLATIETSRYLPELSCAQREQYNFRPLCRE